MFGWRVAGPSDILYLMTTVDDILTAIEHLSSEERADLERRMNDREDDWDRQMRADAKAGKFDALVAAAKADHAAGRTRAVP